MTEQEKKDYGNERTMRMGTHSVPKLLIEFAIPAIVGMLVNGAYNLISAIFLGQACGATGLAVTTAAFPISIVFMALSMLVGMGGNALAALRMGQGRRDDAERVLGNTMTLGIFIAIFIAIIANIPACMEGLLSLSGTTEAIHDLTYSYIWILAMGAIVQIIGYGINNFIRTCGAPNRALLTMVVGAVACIIFNWLFVMNWGWGVKGSAGATILGEAVSCISVLWYFLFTKGTPMKLKLSCMKPDGELIKDILGLGVASFLLQIAACVCQLIINNQIVKYGGMSVIGAENALAAVGVVGRCANIAVLPILGVGTAAQPLFGFNYGAMKIDRVRKTLGFAILFAFIMGVLMWAITRIWPTQIVSAFGVADDLMEFTIYCLNVQMLLIPLIGLQMITGNYFQSTGQPMKSLLISLTRQILFYIPAAFLLPLYVPQLLPGVDGIHALFATWPVSDVLSIFTSLGFVLWELKRLKRVEAEYAEKHAAMEAHHSENA